MAMGASATPVEYLLKQTADRMPGRASRTRRGWSPWLLGAGPPVDRTVSRLSRLTLSPMTGRQTREVEQAKPCLVTLYLLGNRKSGGMPCPDTRDSGGVTVGAGLSFATLLRTSASPAGGELKNQTWIPVVVATLAWLGTDE